MRFKVDLEFPCGYKLKFELRAMNIDTSGVDFSMCPLHGKDCPKKLRKPKLRGKEK